MDNYILDDLINHLLNKSGNKVVDDFIKNAQIDSDPDINMMEFVPYDQFKGIESKDKFSKTYEAYKATWIDGNIQSWNKKEMNLKRSGPIQVVLKKLNDSENVTLEELNKVQYSIYNLIIIYPNIMY